MTSKYQIKIKRDFGAGKGFWLDGGFVKNGFVVVKDHCNCIPGALWFRTIEEAMLAVEVHAMTGDTMKFHEVYRAMKQARA